MSANTMAGAFAANFLGNSPDWYKATIVGFLLLNAMLAATVGPVPAAWVLLAEFIFCLVMALRCYPLQSGGLLVLEAVALGLTSPAAIYDHTVNNFPVIMLLMFMVAGVHFMQDLLLAIFTRVLLLIRSRTLLAIGFCGTSAVLSAFLDALTVIAVVVTVAGGFYVVYDSIASQRPGDPGAEAGYEHERSELDQFRAFLRGLLMHAAAGSALGGVSTLVGEPQNLMVGEALGWTFPEFFVRVAPVSLPVLALGLVTCWMVESTRTFGYGAQLPVGVRRILERRAAETRSERDRDGAAELTVQGIAALLLLIGLAVHAAEVGVIGLTIIVLQTAFNGITDEKRIGHAFQAAMPFTALVVVLFGIVAIIHEQHLFVPLVRWALSLDESLQGVAFFAASGVMSAVSDNVFVASIYLTEVLDAFHRGVIGHEHLDVLGVAINTGTNLPSVATPNGQAAFLFILTSALAPLIRLSYGAMVWMALPYTIVLTGGGLACIMMLT